MTYQDIINRFRQVTEDHLMLQDFGYGDLSDLKYVSQLGDEASRVSYPYLYLLPSSSTRNGPVMNYSFNMIVMDMARTENPDRQQGRRLGKGVNQDHGDFVGNYITIQSQCQQYIDDVLARLYYFYKDQPEITLTGITYTPFKEKYQDVVAGMTATITIQVPTPLNECIAPFDDWTLVYDEYVLNQSIASATVDYNIAAAPNQVAPPFILNAANTGYYKYRFVIDAYFKVDPTGAGNTDISVDPAPYNIPRLVVKESKPAPALPTNGYIREIEFNGQITTEQHIYNDFEVNGLTWFPPFQEDNVISFTWGYDHNEYLPGVTPPTYPVVQANTIQPTGGRIMIYRTPK